MGRITIGRPLHTRVRIVFLDLFSTSFSIKTLVFWLSNKDRRMCLVGEIKSLPAVVNWIFAAAIRTVTGTWLFPSGFGHSRVPRRAPISAKCRLNSKAITIFGPTFSRNRRTSEILSKIRKNAIFPEKRDFWDDSWKSGLLLGNLAICRSPVFILTVVCANGGLTFVSLGINLWLFSQESGLLRGNLAICRSPVFILTVVCANGVLTFVSLRIKNAQ